MTSPENIPRSARIRGTRTTGKGQKTVTLDVEYTACIGGGTIWIRRLGGRPLYGTTGYSQPGSTIIETFRGFPILTEVEWIG